MVRDLNTTEKLPLSGIRVLDASTFIAGPSCAALLGEFGAEVIKVEHPDGGDPLRRLGTNSGSDDRSLLWLNEGRNKQSVTLNLKSERGAGMFRDMAAKADVVIENFRPGTFDRWGLSFETLRAANKGLIMLKVSGYGQDGPYRDLPGFARIAHAVSGLSHLTGEVGGAPLTPGSTSLADYMSGLYGVIGIMMALRSRDGSGQGQMIDVALYESVFRALDEIAPAHAFKGTVRGRQGIHTVNACPHGHFQCKDGKWVAIACTNDKMFNRLAVAMGQPDLAAPDRYQTVQSRIDDEDAVNRIVQGWTGAYSQADIQNACNAGEVPCGAILSIDEILQDPQYAARKTLTDMMVEGVGELPFPSPLPRLSETPGQLNSLGPKLGASNEAIYRELLDLSETDLIQLKKDGVI
jgi:crotonobetainyl-CoA:carnitine CoA-transferase CaiB-like acyl-CoA transferase